MSETKCDAKFDYYLPELDRLADRIEREIEQHTSIMRAGKVIEVVGTLLKVSGLDLALGELCELRARDGVLQQHAEVVGFTREFALLSPFSWLDSISRSTRVIGLGRPLSVKVGDALIGRVVDSLGEPLDGGPSIRAHALRPVFSAPPPPLSRRMIDTMLPTGVRVVDALLSIGEGQRLGIFAPAGVGKSTLMGMFARGTSCDLNVIALIGERGREVREFVEHILREEGMARSVIVCATSDRSALERMKAAHVATTIAEYFRDRGKRVLLMMDSLTRFARAAREIGLAAGEPPARRGFPPSVFAELPRLLERAGMGPRGSITALYTVLAEDETNNDPISEEVRGILDGHITLSRDVAAQNRYPAIEVRHSLSRVMSQVTSEQHVSAAARVRKLIAKYHEVELLLQIGEYQAGKDPIADEAIAKHSEIEAFLSQPMGERAPLEQTEARLYQLVQP
jgi:type III secretion protein N (ATPase)